MRNIEDLTVRKVTIPAGTSITMEKLERAEWFKILDAADTIRTFLLNRLENHVKRRADTGDPEAAEDLKNIFQIRK